MPKPRGHSRYIAQVPGQCEFTFVDPACRKALQKSPTLQPKRQNQSSSETRRVNSSNAVVRIGKSSAATIPSMVTQMGFERSRGSDISEVSRTNDFNGHCLMRSKISMGWTAGTMKHRRRSQADSHEVRRLLDHEPLTRFAAN